MALPYFIYSFCLFYRTFHKSGASKEKGHSQMTDGEMNTCWEVRAHNGDQNLARDGFNDGDLLTTEHFSPAGRQLRKASFLKWGSHRRWHSESQILVKTFSPEDKPKHRKEPPYKSSAMWSERGSAAPVKMLAHTPGCHWQQIGQLLTVVLGVKTLGWQY